jgi:bifunctional non-homologous end joining protein LigD
MSDNTSNTIIESVLLHNDEPPSNKFYEMRLVAAEGGYVVNYRNWRAGTKGLSGTRTKKPLPFADAKRLFDEIFREKTGEGRYKVVEQSAPTADGSTPPPALLPNARVGNSNASILQFNSTGYLPQLLNPVTRGECEELIYNDNFWGEQKVDGKRLLLGFAEELGGVVASNRRGRCVIVTPALSSAIRRLAEVKISGERVRSLCLDGEELSGTYYVFDLHMLGARVFNQRVEHAESLPFGERRALLEELAACYERTQKDAKDDATIRFLPVARTASEKRSLFERLARGRREGIVFKHRESLLHPGRPEAGGDLFKFKFQITVDCVLSVTDDQRRFHCAVFHEGRLQSVGYVSSGIRPSQYDELAREGSMAVRVGEVRALYASGTVEERGQLVQPVFLRFRDDKAPEECTGAQLTPTNKRVLLTTRENAL